MLIGEGEKVTFLKHNIFMQEWKVIAKILLQGYRNVIYLPLILSRAFNKFTLFDQVDKETLPKGFLNFTLMGERDVIKNFQCTAKN